MNQPQSPKRKKKRKKALIFGVMPDAKMGSANKSCKNKYFCPFLPILDAVAKFLLIINSKHPTQKLGFREYLEFGW